MNCARARARERERKKERKKCLRDSISDELVSLF